MDEWTLVTKRCGMRGKTNEKNKLDKTKFEPNKDVIFDQKDVENHERKIRAAMDELEKCGYAKIFLKKVFDPLESCFGAKPPGFHEVVCYGLGSVTTSYMARYQLAMLILMLDNMKISSENGDNLKCIAFDPAFSNLDIVILRKYGINVLTVNEEGRRKVDSSAARNLSLFYMIHCDKFLYDNLLQHNFDHGKISQLAVIGNSFSSMKERIPDRVLKNEYKFINEVLSNDLVIETPFLNWKDKDDVFNDTSIHFFKLVES